MVYKVNFAVKLKIKWVKKIIRWFQLVSHEEQEILTQHQIVCHHRQIPQKLKINLVQEPPVALFSEITKQMKFLDLKKIKSKERYHLWLINVAKKYKTAQNKLH